ncbi:MAG TPA: FAD-dependent oxidoreductase [bacterium]|nr:FAD-dependent oxidoreductase [bacterium]
MIDRGRGYEVAVLGAGCAGSAVAYALARRRLASVVVDAAAPNGAIAAPAAALVQSGTVAEIRLAARSAERFPEFQDAVGPFGYRRTGGMAVALGEAEAKMGQARAAQAGAAGLPVVWLSRDETLRREPGLSERVVGAVYCGYDGVADSSALARRLLAAAVRFGAAAHVNCGSIGVARQNGGFRVRAGREEVVARRLVIASMDALGVVGRQTGVELPQRIGRRCVCVTERVAPSLRHIVNGIRQNPSGEFVLDPPASLDEGGSAEDVRDLVEALRRIATAAARLVPAVAPARILHAPLRVSAEPADGRPAVGRLEDNLYIAVAGADQALTHCPVIGETVAEAVARNRWPEGLDIWAPRRFAVTPAGVGVQDSTERP